VIEDAMAGRSADPLRRAELWVHPGFGSPGGDFTEQDEAKLVRLATLTATALDGFAQLHLPEYRDKVGT
jgi:hypothetical protein